jgi:group I intron endonuclease
MEPSNQPNLSNQNKILDDPADRYCEIYIIRNLVNQKIYIGQAVSHILNHKKYRPYGHQGRFRCHISEAFSKKKNQCHYLNNSIRKHGVDNFEVELIENCITEDANERETFYINHYNSVFPNGYNLKIGGTVFAHSDESKKRVSSGVVRYFEDKKFERFTSITKIDDNVEKYIHPLKRDNIQYGWYVLIEKKKADFGGVHISLEQSKNSAMEFILALKNRLARRLDAGTPLEPSLPLQLGNILEELG